MVSRVNKRQRAWLQTDERHGDQLLELAASASSIGPDAAFDLFLEMADDLDLDDFREAMRPVFQSALLVAAEIKQRRRERQLLAQRRKP